jgi:rod shape-determining protein MreC
MLKRKTVWKWGAMVCLPVALLLLPGGFSARVKAFFQTVTAPIQSGILQTSRSLKAGTDTVRGFSGLVEENRRLKGQVVRLQAEARLSKSIEEENIRLQQLFKFYDRQIDTLIAAEVLSRSINGWWQSVRIAKGTRDGVRPNHAVISPDGLVGRTANVSALSADVLLLSDPACSVSARISRTGSFGLVSGGGVNLKGYPVVHMRFVHKDIPVQIGDTVVTSGLGGVYPPDLVIGYIESVRIEEAGLYQIAEILPQAVMSLTDVVFVSADEGGEE